MEKQPKIIYLSLDEIRNILHWMTAGEEIDYIKIEWVSTPIWHKVKISKPLTNDWAILPLSDKDLESL